MISRRTQPLIIVAVAALAFAAVPAQSQTVGRVVSTEGRVQRSRQGEPPVPAKEAIQIGDRFATGANSLARLQFSGDVEATAASRPLVLDYMNLGDNSQATVVEYARRPTGARARFVLQHGTAYALFANTENAEFEIATPTAVAIATGTAFVVTCTDDSTEVITLSGTVVVRSLVMREQNRVTVGAGSMTTVIQGARSLRVVPVPSERLRQATEGLELIGGGHGESLTVADGVLSGRDVLPAEQANFVLRPHPEILDPCPLPSAPTCIPPEPLGGLGNVEVQF